MEMIPHDLAELGTFVGSEPMPVTLEARGKLELQGGLGRQRSVEVLEQRIWAIDNRDSSGRHVFVHFALHRLPALGPEPALIGGHWQDRTELDSAVLQLDHLELSAGLIKVQPPP